MYDHASLFSGSSKAEIAVPLFGFSLDSQETALPPNWRSLDYNPLIHSGKYV
jgi:hypothetical protein